MNNKEGLKGIVTRLPFVPKVPIGRKDFFKGYLLMVPVVLAVSVSLGSLSGWIHLTFSYVLVVVGSYVMATWYTKRFLDIYPKVGAKELQIILFVLILALGALTSIQAGMLEELRAYANYVAMHGLGASGAPEISESTLRYGTPISVTRAILGVPLLLFALILFLKKGRVGYLAPKNA